MICILYSDAKRKYFPTYEQYLTEAEVIHRARLIETYIRKMGYKTVLFGGNKELPRNLKKSKPKMVMNLVDSVRGQENLCPVIPATLELLNIPYTGSGQMGLAINANKFFTKSLLEENGIRVPRFQLFSSSRDRLNRRMKFPLIVKLNEIHGSVEITQDSIVENEKNLRKRISRLIRLYKQPILVEEFIAGRELTVLLVDGVHKKLYCGERVFIDGGKYKIVSFEAAWGEKDEYKYKKFHFPEKIKEDVKKSFDVLKMDDYARFDIRLDKAGRFYMIDANANPALGPSKAQCAFGTLLDLYKVPFERVLKRLLLSTLRN
jgi:D-alanine-D-alanine ligase